SIHHYRDVPVVLASSAVFLLGAHFLRTFARIAPGNRGVNARGALWATGAMLLGVGSRAEVLTFVGVLIVFAIILWRRRPAPSAATYVLAAAIVSGSLLLVYRLEG